MTNDRILRILIWLLSAAAAVYLLERLYGLLAHFATPLLLFALAWLIALVLEPLVNWVMLLKIPLTPLAHVIPGGRITVREWRMPRVLAVLLVYLSLFAIVIVFAIALVPVIGSQLLGLETTLPAATVEVENWLLDLENSLVSIGYRVDLERIFQPEAFMQQATSVGTTLIQQSVGIVSSIAVLLFNLIIVLILSFYMTLDGQRLLESVLEMLPISWRGDTVRFFAIVGNTFGGFMRAQLVQAVVYGTGTALVMAVLGLSNVALASVLATVLVMIPLVGGLIAVIPPLLIVLIEQPERFLLVLLVLLVLQQVLFNMIMPRLMGQIVGLHPLLVFAALLIGAALAGGWGILFGVPIAGVVASVLQFIYMRATAARPEGN